MSIPIPKLSDTHNHYISIPLTLSEFNTIQENRIIDIAAVHLAKEISQ